MGKLLFAFVVLCCACAKVGPPQGGPVDDRAPRILSHNPSSDQLGVPLHSTVEVVFSEAMDRQRTEEAVFVSPGDPLGFSWRGTALRIEMALRAERTYVVTVGTGARDLRGNALEQSFSLAFATGERLNGGRLQGRVYREREPVRSAHVWAYDLADVHEPFGRVDPAYQTQSGADGQYELLRLAPGAYRLLAFVDEDKDGYPSSDEWVGLPARDVVVEDTLAQAGDLVLVQRGRGDVALERIQALHARMLLLLFSAPVDVDALSLRIDELAIESLRAGDDGRRVYAVTAEQEAGRRYEIEHIALKGRRIKWSEPLRGSGRRDAKPPQWLGIASPVLMPHEPLRATFSEEMEVDLSQATWIESDSTRAPRGTWRWVSPVQAEFVPEVPWETGAWKLVMSGSFWKDRAGLALADSLLAVAFSVEEGRAALRGRVVGNVGAEEVRLYQQQGARRYATRCDAQGHFAFDGLPAGAYQLWAFADEDVDGQWSPGSLVPFVRPEPFVHYVEPIKLSAEEAVEGIELELR